MPTESLDVRSQPEEGTPSRNAERGEALDLVHKAGLERLLAVHGDGLSEYCFSNLYLFRKVHDYKVIHGELPCISGRTYDGRSYLTPLFDISTVTHDALLELAAGHDFFFPVPESTVAKLDQSLFSIECNGDDSDYIYAVEKMSTYRGEKLAKKKNLMKQFITRCNPRIETFDPQKGEAATEILEQWQLDKGKKAHETDYFSCLEAIAFFEELGLSGIICYAGDDPAGFLLAREVHPGVTAIHFAKGKSRYPGVFPYMFNRFADYIRTQADFINFEQDLGNPRFRQTKRSYAPERLLAKFRVRPIG